VNALIVTYWHEIVTYGTPVVVFLGVMLIGMSVRRILFKRLTRWASRTTWQGDDIILQGLRGPFLIWWFLLAVHIATGTAPLPPAWSDIIGKTTSGLLILSISWVVANTTAQLVVLYAQKLDVIMPMTSLTQNIVRILLMSLGLLIFLDTIGVEITSLLAALGIGSLSIALGLQPTLANLFSGIHIVATKHIRNGDYIKLDSGDEGHVVDTNWRSTRICTPLNTIVIVPNAKLSEAIVTNYNLPDPSIAVPVHIGVDYASNLTFVEQVTNEVALDIQRTVPGAVPDAIPLARYHTFGDSSINFTIVLKARTLADQPLIKHEFVKRLHRRYVQENITIPFPTRTLHVNPSQNPLAESSTPSG